MKIGILGSNAQPISLQAKGGAEVFCAILAQNLVTRGHEVYLFASADSSVEGVNLIPTNNTSMLTIRDQFMAQYKRNMTAEEKAMLYDCLNIRTVSKAKEYDGIVDIFHDNTPSYLTAAISPSFKTPIVNTIHMPTTDYFGSYITLPKFITDPKITYVVISKFQQKNTDIRNQIYNGININNFSYSNSSEDHLIWIGRVNRLTPKGLKESIIAAQDTGKKLLFSCFISDQPYFDTEIQPHLNDNIIHVNANESLEAKNNFFSKAKALLFPALWEEPFPLVMLESMACGTPIIAYAKGSLPEFIKDGITGFIVNSSDNDIRGNFIIKKTGIEGLKEAITTLYNLKEDEYMAMRKNCRQQIENGFTIDDMVNNYESLYKQIISTTH